MSALWFTTKCLLFSALIISLMQVRINNITLETKAMNWLETSAVAEYIQTSATGGVLAVKNFYQSLQEGFIGAPHSYKKGHQEEQAGR